MSNSTKPNSKWKQRPFRKPQTKIVLFGLFLAGCTAWAQDSAVAAAQQAGLQSAQQVQQDMMATGQASLQAMQQLGQFDHLLSQQIQTLGVDTNGYIFTIPPWNAWKVFPWNHLDLSVKPGVVEPGTRVRIKWRGSDYAAVYYTTDGWTPTLASNRYAGPIAINATTHLQVVGISWNCNIGNWCRNWTRSPIVDAYYRVTSGAQVSRSPAVVTNGMLRAGTLLKLVTGAEVNSISARPGDKIPLLLAQDIKIGDSVVIPKGTPVDAFLTQAAPQNGRHTPGLLVFQVRSLKLSGVTIKLRGGETMEGRIGRTSSQAVIEPGMNVNATVAADVILRL